MKTAKKLFIFEQYYSLQFFAQDSPTGEKTEEATPRQKRRARERGDIPKSRDLTTILILFVSFIYFYLAGKFIFKNFKLAFYKIFIFSEQLSNIGKFPVVINGFIPPFLLILAPFLGVVFISAVVGELMQVGFLFTLHSLTPNFGRLNPVSGFKRIFSLDSFSQLLKALLRFFLAFYIFYKVLLAKFFLFPRLAEGNFSWGVKTIFSLAFEVAIKIMAIFFILSVLDYFFQRWQWAKKLRMSKYDVKKEYKETEGDPQVKAEMRKRMMKMLMDELMKKVPEADVVITNPTHLAVALKYEREGLGVPQVIAKGAGVIAQKIKKIARDNDVLVVEDKPLARALYKLEVGDPIPQELFEAVVIILAEAFRRKGKEVF